QCGCARAMTRRCARRRAQGGAPAAARSHTMTIVIAGLDPAIHPLRKKDFAKKMDARGKPAHDHWTRTSFESNPSTRSKKPGAGALLELAPGLGAEAHGIDHGAIALRLDHLAAVGFGDQAAEREPAGGDRGIARNGRAAGALEHGEEGAFGGQRRRGLV